MDYSILAETDTRGVATIVGVLLAGIATVAIDYNRSRKEMPLIAEELKVRGEELLLNSRILEVLSHSEGISSEGIAYAESLASLHDTSSRLVQTRLKPQIESAYFCKGVAREALREYESNLRLFEKTLKKSLPSWRGFSRQNF